MTGDVSKEGSKEEDCSCHDEGVEAKEGGNGSEEKRAQ